MNRGIAPLILHLCTICRRVVSSYPDCFIPEGRNLWYPSSRKL